MLATVIGAGPAGSLAALLLARGGCDVTLIERHRFPRHKVCGECLSALGRAVLRRHELEAPLAAIGVPLVRTRLHAGGESVAIDLPQPMLGISRSVLDQRLLDAAAAEGVRVLQPARVLKIGSADEDDGAVNVSWAYAESAEVQVLGSDVCVLANGAATFTADKPAATGDLGIKTHFRHVRAEADAITLYAADGCYGGAAPIENGRWNAAFSVPADRVKAAGGNVAAVFESLIDASDAMRRAFGNADRIEPWLASPLPRFRPLRDWPTNVVPIGNAAAAIEPIGGEGMGLALRSAELAAEAILSKRLDLLPSQYARLWRVRTAGCRLAAKAMTRGRLAGTLIGLMDSTAAATVGMHMIGKGSRDL